MNERRPDLGALITGLLDQLGPDDDIAREKLTELEAEIAGGDTDPVVLEHIRHWFARRVPRLSGSVAQLILSCRRAG